MSGALIAALIRNLVRMGANRNRIARTRDVYLIDPYMEGVRRMMRAGRPVPEIQAEIARIKQLGDEDHAAKLKLQALCSRHAAEALQLGATPWPLEGWRAKAVQWVALTCDACEEEREGP